MNAVKPRSVLLHGRSVNCVEAGSGPVLLLIHGMAGNIGNWQEVIGPLARHHTVVAPDLPGHGASAPGAGDYSLGALAAGLRDLLVVLGHERATLVGHSLGGGIAMQFAYQFPEITERLVLVSSGGLGPEVSPVLRAAALPGAGLFIAATATAGRSAGAVAARGLGAAGLATSTVTAGRSAGAALARGLGAAGLATSTVTAGRSAGAVAACGLGAAGLATSTVTAGRSAGAVAACGLGAAGLATSTVTAGRSAGAVAAHGLAAVGLRPIADVAEVARGYASLADPGRRAVFLATLHSVISTRGQRVHVGDWLYLAEGLPVLIMWGARDPIIPVHHGEHAHEAIPGSRLEIFERGRPLAAARGAGALRRGA